MILIKRKIHKVFAVLALGLVLVLSLGVCRLMTGISVERYAYWETMRSGWENGEAAVAQEGQTAEGEEEKKDFIRWVDFTPTRAALQTAYEWDRETWAEEIHIDWITLLAYGAVKGGGKFNKKVIGEMNDFANAVRAKEKTLEEVEELKYFSYYLSLKYI